MADVDAYLARHERQVQITRRFLLAAVVLITAGLFIWCW